MIKVQMSIDNDGYAVRFNTGNGSQRVGEWSFSSDAKHVGMFPGPLLSYAGFDQYPFLTRVDEHTIHVHSYAVLFIRGTNLRPEGARHNSEHCATIEAKFGVGNDLDAVIAKLHFDLALSLRYFFFGLASLFFGAAFGCGVVGTGSTGCG
jgi:hypothetical protein